MSNLEKIQKVYNVFRIIALIAMIFCFIFAGTGLLGLIGAAIVNDPRIFVGIGRMTDSVELAGSRQFMVNMFTIIVAGTTNGILSMFSMNYFASARKDGTPFTKKGATELKHLGIKTIVMPLCATIVNAIILAAFNVTAFYDLGNGASISSGIFMLLFSIVIAYGAELEEKTKGVSKVN